MTTTQSEKAKRCIEMIEIDLIVPNPWNPNQMTQDDFEQLVAEVERLGHVPDAVLVRAMPDGRYQIVNGEHRYRAARQLGIKEVQCEVVDADEFESMMRTYKMNQSGTHNPVLEGRLFRKMMAEREISQRQLATQMGISEGTVRNRIRYAEAADLRAQYTDEEEAVATISPLTIAQVQLYRELADVLRDRWLDLGADPKLLRSAMLDSESRQVLEENEGLLESDRLSKFSTSYYASEFTADLCRLLPRTRTATALQDNLRGIQRCVAKEEHWWDHGFTSEQLRPYTSALCEQFGFSQAEMVLDGCFARVVDRTKTPPQMRLTLQQFQDTIATVDHASVAEEGLRKTVLALTGYDSGETKQTAIDKLREETLAAEAPRWLQDAELPTGEKWMLWKATVPACGDSEEHQHLLLEAKRRLLAKGDLPRCRFSGRPDFQLQLRALFSEVRDTTAWDKLSVEEHANNIARRVLGTDEGRQLMIDALAGLPREQLYKLRRRI